jgi:hypothetical protein
MLSLLSFYEQKTKNIEETVDSGKKRKIKDESISSRSSSTSYSSDKDEIIEKKSPTKEELMKLLEDANNKIVKLQSTLEVNSLRMY